MTRALKFLPILLALLVFGGALFFEQVAQAQVPPDINIGEDIKVPKSDGSIHSCSDYPDAKGGRLLGRIVPCIIHTIEETSVTFSIAMIDMLQPAFYAFLVFVVTMFGVKVLQGERQIGAHAFLLLIKIAFVIGLLQAVPEIIEASYGVMNDGVAMTTTVLGPETLHCDIEHYGDANTPLVWKQMDCVLGKLYGFTTGKLPGGGTTTNVLLASSAVGLLTGFFFGGTLGVAVFFALIGVLWSVLMVVLRMVLAFVNGYLIVCVMLLIAPIFMPLILLKVTTDYFEKWWKAVMGGLLLPIIITAYSMFAMLLYDKALFADDSLLKKLFETTEIAGFTKAATDRAVEHSRPPCDFNVTGDPNFKAPAGTTKEELDKILKNPFLQSFAAPLLSAGSNACGIFKVPVFDITKVGSDPITGTADPAFKNGKEAMLKIFYNSIELFILAYLIAAGLGTIQGVISSFTGSSLAGAAMTARSETEGKFSQAFGDFKQRLSNAVSGGNKSDFNFKTGKAEESAGGKTGSDFIKAGTEFLGGISRNKN